jgi:uncharacterized membrane protein YphA (DoxX/SURF4 family)
MQRRILWGVRILLALAFAAAGVAKLAAAPDMVQLFGAIGVGQWFRYVTGLIEVLGAVLLIIPSKGFYGAALLTITMIGGTATHLFLIGGSPIPAIVLALLSAFVAWRLRPVRLFAPVH